MQQYGDTNGAVESFEVRFGEPTLEPRRGAPGKFQGVMAGLKARPGEWATIYTVDGHEEPGKRTSAISGNFRKRDGFETRTRSDRATGRGIVQARYVGVE
jgi:hypothetical protein